MATEAPKNSKEYNHYFKPVAGLTHIDVYRVIALFGVTDPALQHAIKKLLVAGGRTAGKSTSKDIQEAIDALERWKEMRAEEQPMPDNPALTGERVERRAPATSPFPPIMFIADNKDFELDPRDLVVDTYRPGGQTGFLNRPDTAVRITHTPSGITVDCGTERSAYANRAQAMKDLTLKVKENWQPGVRVASVDTNTKEQ